MAEQEVLFAVDDKGIALMTLNRPDTYNAINTNIVNNLIPQMFREIQENDAIRVLIFTGAGKAFCSGTDVKERLGGTVEGKVKSNRRTTEEPVGSFALYLAEIRKPVIAAINGIAAGVGFSLALASDFRIASDNARFTTVFVRRALMPDGGMTAMLPLIVGLPKALELAMTSEVIGAEEALRIGLVNKVVPHEELMSEAQALAERLAEAPPISLSFIKRAMYRNVHMSFREALYFESWGQNVLRTTKDHKEGIKSFIEKRAPKFIGE